jgi:hypothetical protein
MDEDMPDVLKEFLESLSDADAAIVHEYLDSNKECLDSMIAIVAQ